MTDTSREIAVVEAGPRAAVKKMIERTGSCAG